MGSGQSCLYILLTLANSCYKLSYKKENGGLGQDEALEQVRWLTECGMVDFVEISGGNAENKTSKLHRKYHDALQVVS